MTINQLADKPTHLKKHLGKKAHNRALRRFHGFRAIAVKTDRNEIFKRKPIETVDE
jgi:hypothetical protein